MLFIVFSLRFYICCYLIADVIHCTLCSGFFCNQHFASISPVFRLSISFIPHYRRFIVFILLPFPGMRSLFCVCSLMADVFHCIYYCFYNCKKFCLLQWLQLFALLLPACSLLLVPYYRLFLSLYHHTFVQRKLCFSFYGMRSSSFVIASWPMCLLLCCCSSSPRHFNLFVFSGMRSSFIHLFPHGRCYSSHFYHFYIQQSLPGTIALVFRFSLAHIQFLTCLFFVPYDWRLSYYLFLLFLVIISFALVCLFVCSVLFSFVGSVRSSLILFVTLFLVTTPYGVRILLGLLSGMISFINLFVNSWPM